MSTTASPEGLGFSGDRLERIGALMNRYVDERKLPGVLTMIARRGQTAYLHKCGFADVAAARPLEFDTIFRIMSMTKPITSIAAMLLYEEAAFDISTHLSATSFRPSKTRPSLCA